MSVVRTETRQKWAEQIRATIEQLHAMGVIWADRKASNVIIDAKNAWLIDFGGGWTNGWVSEELTDSLEGDAQAMSWVREFLGVQYVTSNKALAVHATWDVV